MDFARAGVDGLLEGRFIESRGESRAAGEEVRGAEFADGFLATNLVVTSVKLRTIALFPVHP